MSQANLAEGVRYTEYMMLPVPNPKPLTNTLFIIRSTSPALGEVSSVTPCPPLNKSLFGKPYYHCSHFCVGRVPPGALVSITITVLSEYHVHRCLWWVRAALSRLRGEIENPFAVILLHSTICVCTLRYSIAHV